MKKSTFLYSTLLLIFLASTNYLQAQLGFCSGNSGEPILTETFGTGTDRGPELPAGTTTYTYNTGTPDDGSYTIASTTNFFDWHNTTDHTPGDVNGKAFIVNAHFTAGEFYRQEVTGLCENTSYEFSSWLINLQNSAGFCDNGGLPINVRFQIWDSTDTNLITQGDTGNITSTPTPIWEQYALVFKTIPGQTAVILKMINNGNGGCGNDLGIDDIVFKSCGDYISVENPTNETGITSCANLGPISTTLTATPDLTVFTQHSYQWQESTDGLTWTDIAGAITNIYNTQPTLTTTHYRAKVAEDPINISNDLCNVLSDVFSVIITPVPQPPVSNGDLIGCTGDTLDLNVASISGILINWYDAAIGGTLVTTESTIHQATTNGTFYAEAVSIQGGCISLSRTAVTSTINPIPDITDQELSFCEGTTIFLSAEIDNVAYSWSTGENTKTISVDTPGTYSVIVTDNNGCTNEKEIQLTQIDSPVIDTIKSDGPSILVTTTNSGDFEYAVGNGPYQNSPIFDAIPGGEYIITARERNFCGMDLKAFTHIVLPKFFTPNGDDIYDIFIPEGITTSTIYQLNIYNRYGKLLLSSNDINQGWNGTFNGEKMPNADYWYTLIYDGGQFSGHFALKR